MLKQFPIRYGRNYKMVIAIVLPSLLIVPFIFLMSRYKGLFKEWEEWLIIFSFLGFVILLSVWLVFKIYPKAIISINKQEISLFFNNKYLFLNTDFTFSIKDIVALSQHEINGDTYFIFETSNPSRKFQISASSFGVDDFLAFNEAMFEISELINSGNKNEEQVF